MDQGAVLNDEQRQAVEALATVRAHQERTRRAARVPWWGYAGMFVLTAGITAANDVVDVTGAKLIAGVVMVLFLVTVVVMAAGRVAPMSRVRGVQARQSFHPRVFLAVAVVAGAGAWVASRYGAGIVHGVAGAVGMGHYPNTVAGVVFGAAFTALFALGRGLVQAAQRRADQ
jgi:hypothetical protein